VRPRDSANLPDPEGYYNTFKSVLPLRDYSPQVLARFSYKVSSLFIRTSITYIGNLYTYIEAWKKLEKSVYLDFYLRKAWKKDVFLDLRDIRLRIALFQNFLASAYGWGPCSTLPEGCSLSGWIVVVDNSSRFGFMKVWAWVRAWARVWARA
jgi:hypothetical protein